MAKGPVKRLLDLAAKEFPEISETFGIATPRRTKGDAPTLAVKSDVVEPLAVRPQIAIRTKPSGIIAYHGAPHTFHRFDMSKIGTGEGSQAYGHGLYFAENEAIAKGYRDALTQRAFRNEGGFASVNMPMYETIKGQIAPGHPDYVAARLLEEMRSYGVGEDWIKREIRIRDLDRYGGYQKIMRGVKKLKEGDISKVQTHGSMYQVRIDADPEDFLDYDSPLSVQPRAMQALRDVDLNAIKEGNRTRVMLERALQGAEQTEYPAKGQTLSVGLDTIFGENSKPASDFLNERGLKGVKYLDQGSRTAGDGSRNFVVFDDDLINILKRYRDGGLAVKKKKKPRVSKRKALPQSSPNSSM